MIQKSSSTALAVFLLLFLVGITAGEIKNVAKDKKVNTGSPPSNRGSSDISVIVDGDRDGKITAWGFDPLELTNSQVECTACYISTSTDENMWIRIDLVDEYFITEINVIIGNQFLAMTRINILTKNDTGNVNPVNRKSSWTNVYYEERGLVEWTVNIRPASYSRFVAVVRESSGGLTLSEVEVFGYAPGDFKPRNLILSQTTPDCVRLDWDNPYTDVQANYQYSCGTSLWTSSGSNTYGTVCGRTPAVGLQCNVRVDDVTQTEVHDTLNCSNLIVVQPADLTFSTGIKVENGGRWRYQYSVSWKVPSSYTSCAHLSNPYRVEIDSTTESKVVNNYNKESYTVYGDSEDTITVKVQIRNTDGDLSSPATKSLKVPIGLSPQVAPENFKLTAVSPYCVSLSYDPVLYPNGPESGLVYQYNCNSDGWNNIPSDKRVCGFTPNTLVNCEIRARRGNNSDGNKDSEVATDSETTCNNPFQSSSLQFNSPTMVTISGRRRWKYTVTWKVSSTYNCKESSYRYKLKVDDETTLSSSASTRTTIYRDGNVGVSAEVWLIQRNGDLSESVKKSIVTKQGLPPQVAPKNFKLTALSSYCVNMSYDPVLYPNGPQSGLVYQVKCNSQTWTIFPDSKELCGYKPYELVTCAIRARRESNSQENRNSVISRDSVRTDCAAPILPKNLSKYMIQSRYTPSRSDTRKIKIQFNLPDQDVKINCESVKLKEFKLDGSTVYLNHNSYINDLLPYKNYTIQVKVTNNKDLTTADMLVIETWELEPYDSPVILRNESYNESCIFIQWRSPSQPNGVIKRYQHRHYIRDNSVPQWLIYTDVQTENSYLACGYKAGDLVTYEIRAGTKVGYGPEATGDVRVTCGYPSIPEYSTVSSTHTHMERERIWLNITWKESYPACASISHYDLTIRLNEQQFFYKRYSAEETREKVLEDLDPYTNYTIILLAVNNAFNQSSAEPRYISTPELAPYDEPSLSLDFDTSCAHLTIQDPTQPNGIITEYQYTCYYANTEEGSYQNILATDRQPVSLCKFRSAEKVKCSAKAINSVGESPVTSQTGYTRIAMNQNDKAELRKTKNVGKSFVIRVNQVTLNNKKPNSYVFVVQKETSTSKRKKRSSVQLPPECDLDPDCYITAEIDSSLVDSGGYDFRVGDGKTYQDYYNAPLEPNQGYKIYQAVTVQNEDGTILVEYFKDPISVILKPACDHNCTIAVSVTISIAVLTVVVVGIIFVMRKRQGKGKESRNSNHQLDEISGPPRPGRSSSKPTIAESLRRSLQRNDVYEQFESTSLGIGNLEDYVEQKQHIKDQYKAFNSIPKPVMSAALLAENKGKCRYKGLYPADETRVVLQRESSTESDFINASYIYGFSPEARKTFIAAQGPMKATVDDFWLMIWQQRPKAVVMVTNVIEDGKQKCEQYWPDDTSTELRYGDITVSMVSAEEWAEYVVRVLNVEKSGEKRRVRQYHYTAWPDHGVPDTMSPFISFYKKIKTETYRIDGALLVHCSAGVGRTGTFIAMNNLLEQAEIHQQVDFSECVRKMRANRPSMVQTVEQYVFLHGVVNELLATSKYPCAPSDIQTKLAKHREANSTYSNMATAEIDEEFLRIGRYVSDHGLDVEEGRKPENSNKNRNMSVLPPSSPSATDKKEKYLRPVISSGNGYINAVMVNAYRKQNQFIATQLPLVNTMTDFWQMIEEYRVSVIVQLDPCNADEQFYPLTNDDKPLTFGDFVVVRLTTEPTENLESITLRVTKSQSSRNVYVLQKTNWSRADENSNAETLSFLEMLEKHQQKTGNHNICVTSLDGGAKCGMFICSHNAIEKMKAEQEADLYSTVLMARLRRPQFVTTLESYLALYNLLREFGDNFSDYANFK